MSLQHFVFKIVIQTELIKARQFKEPILSLYNKGKSTLKLYKVYSLFLFTCKCYAGFELIVV